MPWSLVSTDLRFLWTMYWDAPIEKRNEIKDFIHKMTTIITAQTNLITQISRMKNRTLA